MNRENLITELDKLRLKLENNFIKLANDQCWIWRGFKDRQGYGKMGYDYKTYKVSRLSYLVYKGKIENNMLVCHSCDNPTCVNPNHLFLGTNRDNTQDMIRKGRSKLRVPYGEKNGSSKLTATLVRVIREASVAGFSRASVGRYFKISPGNITTISLGNTWKHVQ